MCPGAWPLFPGDGPARRVHFPGRTDALRVSESLRDSEVGFPAASRNSPA